MLAHPRYFKRQARPVAKRNGFTLVELLTVVAIILILAGIVVGVQRGVYASQANARAKAEIQTIATALEQYKAAYGTYPRIPSSGTAANDPERLFRHLTGQVYSVYKVNSEGSYVWQEESVTGTAQRPFIDAALFGVDDKKDAKRLRDPWQQDYIYLYSDEDDNGKKFGDHFFILYSTGADKKSRTVAVDIDRFTSKKKYFEGTGDPNGERLDDIVFGLENN